MLTMSNALSPTSQTTLVHQDSACLRTKMLTFLRLLSRTLVHIYLKTTSGPSTDTGSKPLTMAAAVHPIVVNVTTPTVRVVLRRDLSATTMDARCAYASGSSRVPAKATAGLSWAMMARPFTSQELLNNLSRVTQTAKPLQNLPALSTTPVMHSSSKTCDALTTEATSERRGYRCCHSGPRLNSRTPLLLPPPSELRPPNFKLNTHTFLHTSFPSLPDMLTSLKHGLERDTGRPAAAKTAAAAGLKTQKIEDLDASRAKMPLISCAAADESAVTSDTTMGQLLTTQVRQKISLPQSRMLMPS